MHDPQKAAVPRFPAQASLDPDRRSGRAASQRDPRDRHRHVNPSGSFDQPQSTSPLVYTRGKQFKTVTGTLPWAQLSVAEKGWRHRAVSARFVSKFSTHDALPVCLIASLFPRSSGHKPSSRPQMVVMNSESGVMFRLGPLRFVGLSEKASFECIREKHALQARVMILISHSNGTQAFSPIASAGASRGFLSASTVFTREGLTSFCVLCLEPELKTQFAYRHGPDAKGSIQMSSNLACHARGHFNLSSGKSFRHGSVSELRSVEIARPETGSAICGKVGLLGYSARQLLRQQEELLSMGSSLTESLPSRIAKRCPEIEAG